MDARFHDDFVVHAKRLGKLRHDYVVPSHARGNTPRRLEQSLQPFRERGMFSALPFGSDFTDEELVIAKALRRLQSAMSSSGRRVATLARALCTSPTCPELSAYLQRLELDQGSGLRQMLERRLVAWALRETMEKTPP
jgi:hypothetical protein